MIKQIYALKDLKVNAYAQPFFQENSEVALRGFSKACKQEGQLADFPEDYVLYHIGSFDELSGEITPIQPVSIGTAAQYVKGA